MPKFATAKSNNAVYARKSVGDTFEERSNLLWDNKHSTDKAARQFARLSSRWQECNGQCVDYAQPQLRSELRGRRYRRITFRSSYPENSTLQPAQRRNY